VIGSLLDGARDNLSRGADRIALFESGRVYLAEAPPGPESSDTGPASAESLAGEFPGERPAPFHEPHRLAAVAVGSLAPGSWRDAGVPADFFALKGVLEALAGQLGAGVWVERAEQPFLHPGRSAAVAFTATGADSEPAAGWIGELHPLVCRTWDIESAAGFEFDLAALVRAATAGEEAYEDVTSYPAVYQDLAVVVPAASAAAAVREAILGAGAPLLRSAEVFDLYEGEQLGEGSKSLALRLEFRAGDRTLTDEEVAGVRASIEARLAEIGGSIRE
jgi:phenylalanyl-tRNA synthetase beta chain